MKKFKGLFLTVAFICVSVLMSCTSPESAAEKVCECMSKVTSSANASEMAGNAAECEQVSAKYRDKFEGEDLNMFVQKVTQCTVGNALMR